MKKLGFGFMRLPVLDENDRSTVDFSLIEKMVDLYMNYGFSYFDMAHRYNNEISEVALYKTLTSRYSRKSYILANKITLDYIHKEEEQYPFFINQLKICGVKYFDLYLIHNMGEVWYPYAKKFNTFEFVKDMQEQGFVKHIGFSFHGTPKMLQTILEEHPETEYVQLQINYLDWNDIIIKSKECYEIARKFGKKIIVMEPIKGGTLINLPNEAVKMLKSANPKASLASWAIRFAAGLDGVEMVLSGMSDLRQVVENTSFMSNFKPLNADEYKLIEKTAEIIRNNTEISCTNCHYCTTECPKNITIPDYFALYNNKKRLLNTAYMSNQGVYYANLTEKFGKASDCIGCGLCEKNCPQRLNIRELLKNVALEFEKGETLKISQKTAKDKILCSS